MKKRLLNYIFKTFLIVGFVVAPMAVLAADFVGPCQEGTIRTTSGCLSKASVGGMLATIQTFINSLIPLIVAIGVVYFVWGVVMFMIADSEEAKTKGKDHIIYGLIGFAVILGMWGMVNIVVNTLGFDATNTAAPSLQAIQVNTTNSSKCTVGGDFQGLAQFVTCVINNSIIPLIFALAVVMFIWGAVKFFIINSDEEAKRDEGKQFMIWGIIALTVMVTVWGLVGFLSSTFNLGNGKLLPQVCPPGSTQCGKQNQ